MDRAIIEADLTYELEKKMGVGGYPRPNYSSLYGRGGMDMSRMR